MTTQQRKFIMTGIAACALTSLASFAFLFLHEEKRTEPTSYIYIDPDDNADSVQVKSGLGWRFKCYGWLMEYTPRTGRYLVEDGMKSLRLYRNLRNRHQEPLNLVIPSSRTMEKLAGVLSGKIMLDSLTLVNAFTDNSFCNQYGYTTATLPSLFVPNSYQIYWDITLEQLMKRMQKENKAFWNDERQAKARQTGFTHEEIATLASIVDEETANDGEKPMIAGMYINRIRRNMPLQADPTVKFAIGDFSLRRIYHEHLKFESPYNTYIHEGLPPGPIRIPSIAGLDAVLNYVQHPYLYMCAKEDFSGTHNFAATYSEHLNNARKYTKALNERNIK